MVCSRFSSESLSNSSVAFTSSLCLTLIPPLPSRDKTQEQSQCVPDLTSRYAPLLHTVVSVQGLFLLFLHECLFLHQFSEQSLFVAQQLRVRAALGYMTLVENSHGVRVLYGGQAVSDDHDCPPCGSGGAEDIDNVCVKLDQLSKTLNICNK